MIGNGGSAANAMHLINDFLALGIKAYTLDLAALTACANDFGYDAVFERWINTVGERGDLLLALSGSGNSPNIVKALVAARQRGMTTFSMVGDFGLSTAPILSDTHISVGATMQEAENAQLVIGHQVMKELRGMK